METFYTDKEKVFECNIQVEGSDINETQARLVLMFENKRNLIFFGDVDSDGTCRISIPALKELKEGKGKVALEVISESLLFEPWSSSFELKPSKRVTVEVKQSKGSRLTEQITPKTPVVTVSQVGGLKSEQLSDMVKAKLFKAMKTRQN